MAQVYLGQGDKRTVTVDRITTNFVGIAMAIVLALLPPALYGGNPKWAQNVLKEERALLAQCLELILSQTKCQTTSVTDVKEQFEQIRVESVGNISKLLDEANDFYSDANRFDSLHFLRVDPKLKQSLDSLQVISSWIFVSARYAVQLLSNPKHGEHFLADDETRCKLETLLQELKSGSSSLTETTSFEKLTIQDEEGGTSTDKAKSIIFINCVIRAMQKLEENEARLETVKYGLFSC